MRSHRSSPISWGWPQPSPRQPVLTQSIRQAKRRAREKELAVVLVIALGIVEVLRRSPAWLLILVGLLVLWLYLFLAAHIWWVVAGVAGAIAFKIVRGFVEGWRSWDDIPY